MHSLLKRKTELGLESVSDELSNLILSLQKQLERPESLEKQLNDAFDEFPDVIPSHINLDSDEIRIGLESDLNSKENELLYETLRNFHPWRKGPFDIFGVHIDTEWKSYIKWDRVKNHIQSLTNRRILDIGCSSGYYMFRMASQKPKIVIGIEPYLRFYFQYLIIQKYVRNTDLCCIPTKFEELPSFGRYFDIVFCMGILYHSKSPIDTLKRIHDNMKAGGELILETLIIEGDSEIAFFPEDRYAKMRNVYFIPTILCLTFWLKRSGFTNIRCVDTNPTTLKEQRRTDWIETESLEDFLDSDNPGKTIEGYPAPLRSIVIANAR